MATQTFIEITAGTLVLAATEAGLTTGQAVECQIVSAAVDVTANLQTVAATWCSGQTQSPSASTFTLNLTWLQDWDTPLPGGLSLYAWDNDTKTVWFRATPTSAVEPTIEGQARVVAGSFGGAAGTPLQATAAWPCIGKPAVTSPPVVPLTRGVEADQLVDA